MKKVRVADGKPIFYEPKKVKETRQLFTDILSVKRPKEPFEGAVRLSVLWLFPAGKSHHDKEYKTTRPDTDNLEKLLKDCMTSAGWWKNDAQVAVEVIEKRWSEANTGIDITVEALKDEEA